MSLTTKIIPYVLLAVSTPLSGILMPPFFGGIMASEFKSWRDFALFSEAVTKGRRHVLDAESRQFLEVVGETSKTRIRDLPKGSTLCRAQIANTVRSETAYDSSSEEEVEIAQWAMPCDEGRLRPFSDRAKEGRANPKGRPAFYAAFDEDTAVAEVRPWIGTFVSVGCFATKRSLRLVDCSRHVAGYTPKTKFKYAIACVTGKDTPRMREESVWMDIERAFAKPVSPSDELADYLPTQVLSEQFLHEGYDGLMFKSSVASGTNVVLFRLDEVELCEPRIARITGIKVDYKIGSYDGLELHE